MRYEVCGNEKSGGRKVVIGLVIKLGEILLTGSYCQSYRCCSF